MQHLANTAWASLARRRCQRDAALFAALARADFNEQDFSQCVGVWRLAVTAWAFAMASQRDCGGGDMQASQVDAALCAALAWAA